MEFYVFITFSSVCQFVWDPIHSHTMHSCCLVITKNILISRWCITTKEAGNAIYVKNANLTKQIVPDNAKIFGQSSRLPTKINGMSVNYVCVPCYCLVSRLFPMHRKEKANMRLYLAIL